MLVRRFTRSELAVHWTLAVSVLLMILTGIALGANVWHAAAFPVHVGSVFLLAGGVLLAALLGDRPALGRAARQLRTLDPDDRRWLAWAPRNLLGGGDQPPPVGRFNGGQKLNSMLTGSLLVASTGSGLYWWAAHEQDDGDAGHVVDGAVEGHGLRGITTGSVDVRWAAEHHPAWLAETGHDAGDAPAGGSR